jgi:ABC-2 type transport system ATP-binding protein
MARLEVRKLTKRFGERQALRGVNLEIRAGQVYGLLGSNGAGKTTALNIIAGLLTPDGGVVRVDDAPLTMRTKRFLGVVPQEIAVYQHLTCDENLRFFASLYGLRGDRLSERVEITIRLCQLEEYRDAPVSVLSGGWQHRVNLAVGIVHAPKLLLLDEPTTGQDLEARYILWDAIGSLRDQGTAVLLTTHMMEEAEAVCQTVGILHGGRIVREGTLAELYATIPAAELAEIETDDVDALRGRTAELGLSLRRYGGRWSLLLPARSTLPRLASQLESVPIRSLALRPVGLQHVFFDVTQGEHPLEEVLA